MWLRFLVTGFLPGSAAMQAGFAEESLILITFNKIDIWIHDVHDSWLFGYGDSVLWDRCPTKSEFNVCVLQHWSPTSLGCLSGLGQVLVWRGHGWPQGPHKDVHLKRIFQSQDGCRFVLTPLYHIRSALGSQLLYVGYCWLKTSLGLPIFRSLVRCSNSWVHLFFSGGAVLSRPHNRWTGNRSCCLSLS